MRVSYRNVLLGSCRYIVMSIRHYRHGRGRRHEDSAPRGQAATDSKAIEGAVRDLRVITGQQPMVTRARKSIATFDGRGDFSMGVTEQLIFPEVDFDSVDRTRGMDITIVTTAKTDEEGRALLDGFGFPFKK